MKTVKLTVRPTLADIFMRQTPGCQGIWGDCRFVVNASVEECDWWVVCHNTGLVETERTMCDPRHIVYVSLEPSDSWLAPEFLRQFSKLVLCDRSIAHPDVLYRTGLNWWVGITVRFASTGSHVFSPQYTTTYDDLVGMSPPSKPKLMSVICSTKNTVPGHKPRMRFIEKLRAHRVSRHIDFFGGGTDRPIDDKWDAIAPYRYHLAIENAIIPDYWTEKLSDAFLGFAHPVYAGCPNIAEYFSPDALTVVDLNDFDRSVDTIERLLESDTYERSLPGVLEARNQVLNDYNLFQLMADICADPAGTRVPCELRPRASFEVPARKASLVRRAAGKLLRIAGLRR